MSSMITEFSASGYATLKRKMLVFKCISCKGIDPTCNFDYFFQQLFIDRMSQSMEMQFKGKAFVNITGRALRKNFSLELESPKIIGKAVLGGRTCL